MCLYGEVTIDDPTDDRLRALASVVRRGVLRLVRDKPRSVTEITTAIGVSQPAISQHLAVLREAGLVTVEAAGRRRLYRADLDAMDEMRRFFDEYWSSALDRLADSAETAMDVRRVAS